MLGCLAVAVAAGVWLFRGHKSIERRDYLVRDAIKLVKENATLPAAVRAETYRAAAEYVLAQPEGKAETARDNLTNARGVIADHNATAQPFERIAMLTRIAITQTGLIGDATQIRAAARLDWTATLQELRRTLMAFDDSVQWEGTVLAVRAATRSLGMAGPNNQQAILNLVHGRFTAPEEKADAQAAVGLELYSTGEAGKAKAKEIAEQLKGSPEAAVAPRVIALLAATGVSDPGSTDSPALAVRVGAAEGYARRGDLDAARAIARKPGSPEDRFQALVAIAAAQPTDPDLSDAVKFFADEFKARDLPDWPLIQLSQICGEAKSPTAAKSLNAALAELANLSPRSQAVRAWAQMELLRAQTDPTEATVKAITPDSALGHLLAWELLARRTAPSSVEAWPAPVRPLGLVGSALGSMK
jgi:hypothetical protein